MEAKLYRKMPVTIEAVKHDGTDIYGIIDWIDQAAERNDAVHDPYDGAIVIKTLEGNITASPGDYIIKGVQGEFYPCKAAIFEATYEAVS
ncbi:hypothetical protein [Brevibacterium antiquum]|uniref:Phage protein n=1 Tax=Brevibacterium antiquum TaxID=234835 RepID=A0A2H1INB5_9MICO|nr:hypothetical protein [Brevibacterium antiquum]SMX76717.1 hypothetical protein BANT10_01125 [Brevibacterium antiquum]